MNIREFVPVLMTIGSCAMIIGQQMNSKPSLYAGWFVVTVALAVSLPDLLEEVRT